MSIDTKLKLDDIDLSEDQAYLRNKRLPRTDAEFEWTPQRIAELKKCTGNLRYFSENYFYITTVDDGKQKISLYTPQKRILTALERERFVIVCASRQVGKTTTMSIYALWITCFNADKRVVIVANKEKTAIMILRRIKMAYEELPNWLKPGTGQWGNTEVVFGNGSSIAISTTTGSAVRGDTVNCIIIDEMAHIEPHLVEEFWASVVPVISSTRKGTTKIFAVSTPNGTGNRFYKLFSAAERNEAVEGSMAWHAEKIDWWEIPGRGKKWKYDMMTALGGDEQLFKQEFENFFIETGETAVDADVLEKYKQIVRAPIHTFDNGHYKIWEEPQHGRIYGIGVDVSEGIGRNASVAQILDFTDLTRIQMVGSYHNNLIHPLQFAEMLNRIGNHWGRPPMLIERNSCGGEVINSLQDTHKYTNIVSHNPDKTKYGDLRPGVYSHTNTKYNGVMNMRYWVNTLKVVEIYDVATIQEMETFVRYPNGTWRAKQERGTFDDRVMSLIWGLFILDEAICQQYYEIHDYDDRGKPLKIGNYTIEQPMFFKLDNLFQKDPGAPLPAFIGYDPMSLDENVSDLLNKGWRALHRA